MEQKIIKCPHCPKSIYGWWDKKYSTQDQKKIQNHIIKIHLKPTNKLKK